MNTKGPVNSVFDECMKEFRKNHPVDKKLSYKPSEIFNILEKHFPGFNTSKFFRKCVYTIMADEKYTRIVMRNISEDNLKEAVEFTVKICVPIFYQDLKCPVVTTPHEFLNYTWKNILTVIFQMIDEIHMKYINDLRNGLIKKHLEWNAN